jgi:hypothetical protein
MTPTNVPFHEVATGVISVGSLDHTDSRTEISTMSIVSLVVGLTTIGSFAGGSGRNAAVDGGNCYGCQDNSSAYLGMSEEEGENCLNNLRRGIVFCYLTYQNGKFKCIESDPTPCGFGGPMRADEQAGSSDSQCGAVVTLSGLMP